MNTAFRDAVFAVLDKNVIEELTLKYYFLFCNCIKRAFNKTTRFKKKEQ